MPLGAAPFTAGAATGAAATCVVSDLGAASFLTTFFVTADHCSA